MSTAAAVPLPKRVPLGVWVLLTWIVSTLYEVYTGRHGWDAFMGHMTPYLWTGLLFSLVLLMTGAATSGRHPLGSYSLVLAGAVGTALIVNSMTVAFSQFTAVALPLAHLAATRPRRLSLTALAITLTVLAAYAAERALMGWRVIVATQVAVGLTAVVTWFLGDTLRLNREQALATSRHVAAQAATTERLRIARELHDMVAHTIGVIALQAGAAAMLMDAEPAPPRAREAVRAIESSSRETLAGLRRMLVSLRSQNTDSDATAPPGSPPRPDLAPMPGLGDLERLAAQTTAAGVRVDLACRGERRPLPPEIELAAFRIVQESVTNVVRHARTDRCRVMVDYTEAEVRIEVVDEGAAAGPGATAGLRGGGGSGPGTGPGPGYGLIGIRERVGLLHGEFAAAPRPGGGFRVAASLPIPAPTA